MKQRITILLSGFFFILQLQAQHQPFFINNTESDGLSDNRITCFYKDRKGYVWIGTESGLNRFNGNSFKIYRPVPSQKTGLSDAYITSVAQDQKGDIWVATRKGLNRIDALADTTEIIHAMIGDHFTLQFENVWDVFPENDTAVWITIDTKYLLRYNPVKKKLSYFDFREHLVKNKIEYTPKYHSIFKIVPRSANELWLATTEGIFSFNKRNGSFSLVYGVALDRISYFRFEAANGKLYCADERNILYIYDDNTRKMSSIDIGVTTNQNRFLPPYTAGRNGLLIPAPEGLVWVNEINEVDAFIATGGSNENGLPPGRVTTVYKDNKGISWIGTEKGMSRFVPALNTNLHVTFPQNLHYDIAYSLKNFFYNKERNEWLVASFRDNKIWKVDNKTGLVSPFTNPFKADTCYSFYSRHPDTLYLLCDNVLLTYFYPTNSWSRQTFPAPWNEGTLTCMTIDADGNYWLGTRRKGFFVFDPVHKTIGTTGSDQHDITVVHALQYDPYHNCVWIGSYSNGLYSYSFADKTFRNLPRQDADPGSFHSSLINDIATDRKRNTWCATMEGGLTRYSPATGVINFEANDGLPDNNIYSVAIDTNDEPWFTTSKGIGWMTNTGDRKLFLNRESGLPFSKFQQSIACIPGHIVATTVDNDLFAVFTPALLQREDNELLIDKIQLNDTILLGPGKHLFSYKQNTFRFDYSLLDFTTPGATRYYCKLEGFDKDWIPNGHQSSIRYAGLKPGTYTFIVKAQKADGTINKQVASWQFVIASPFWQTWWFKILILLLVGGTAAWLYKRRVQKIKKDERLRNEYEKRIAETEMQALRAQMNPHFMFNSLNSINNFILKNDPDNASGYLTKFSRLMRLILDNSRSEWVLLESELKALELYIELEALRFDHAFNYSLEVATDINVESVMVPPLIIQPYVENAIWHGLLHRKEPGGRIDVQLWKNNGTLFIQVEDNGVGRAEAKRLKSKTATRQKSHGMRITAERMDIVNKVYKVNAGVTLSDLDDTTGHTGTRVLITLNYKTHDSDHSR